MNNKREEIKELIKSGYDLELISLELDISREEINDCIEEIREEVGKLVASGYDLDLICFELDIPIKLINQYKLQTEPAKPTNLIYESKNKSNRKYSITI